MSPPLTLKETMRAAGDPRLTEWHQKLVSKGNEKKKLEENLNTDISKRDQVLTQMAAIRPDVEQFNSRQEKEKEVSFIFLVNAIGADGVRKRYFSCWYKLPTLLWWETSTKTFRRRRKSTGETLGP